MRILCQNNKSLLSALDEALATLVHGFESKCFRQNTLLSVQDAPDRQVHFREGNDTPTIPNERKRNNDTWPHGR